MLISNYFYLLPKANLSTMSTRIIFSYLNSSYPLVLNNNILLLQIKFYNSNYYLTFPQCVLMELTIFVDSVTFLYCLSLDYVLPLYKMKHVSDFFSSANAIVVGKIIASQNVQALILGTH